MSYTYHGATGLVTLPDREVQTFPSGLVRVTRSYVCRKGLEARHRETLQVGNPLPGDSGAPAIDGLYIYPEPQEITRDDGFVEFRVTAYGRTSLPSGVEEDQETGGGNLNVRTEVIKGNYTLARNIEGESQQFSPPALLGAYIVTAVAPASSSIDNLLIRPNVASYVRPISPTLGVLPPLVGQSQGNPTVELFIVVDSFNSTNYGFWNEVNVTWLSRAYVSE